MSDGYIDRSFGGRRGDGPTAASRAQEERRRREKAERPAQRPKLTERMRSTLVALKPGPRSSYPGLSLVTLEALRNRGLVRSVAGHGSMWCPQVAITWRLTAEGWKEAGK